jgi:hypothetical protein
MHWMNDWASPSPIFAAQGVGAQITDVDGKLYDDFCLGDTPSMFGHGDAAVASAVADQIKRGAGFMLPTASAVIVGRLLAERFGLPLWQTATTASDANRAAIRWARAVTQRPVILVFDGCYHGMVEDAFVVLKDGVPAMKPGLLGQVQDLTATTRVVPFNDVAALKAALAPGDVAAVLAEPVMTNCGMILPEPGFLDALSADPRGRDPADPRRDPHPVERPRRLHAAARPGARHAGDRQGHRRRRAGRGLGRHRRAVGADGRGRRRASDPASRASAPPCRATPWPWPPCAPCCPR